jgi:5'-phosphate synthase pdxT subunit
LPATLGSVYHVFEPLIEGAAGGSIAVLGTCAGAILLAAGPEPPPRFGLVPATVIRNAYGRQKESFTADFAISFLDRPFHGIFIRAPRIELPPNLPGEVEILGACGGDPVLVRYRRILLATFHPELSGDTSIHRYFLAM